MKMLVYTRHALSDAPLDDHAPAVLLEGSWPRCDVGAGRVSLDDMIGARFEWIDLQASHWSEQLGRVDALVASDERLVDVVTPAYLNALALRYYLVKLMRVAAFFTEVQPVGPTDAIELVAARNHDEDYADLMTELARATGVRLHIRWRELGVETSAPASANGPMRRGLGKLAGLWQPRLDKATAAHRAVLCGEPRVLDPVCHELLNRGCRVWWLHDSFSPRSWLAWRARGVGQLVCDSSHGRRNRLTGSLPERLTCCGVNLTPALGRWLARRMQTHGRMQTRALEQIECHFHRLCPDSLMLSEDATPLARAAVAVTRRHRVASFVVQHGAPVGRFSFAPVAADRLLAWGRSSAEQLVGWGVPRETIQITGSPRHDGWFEQLRHDVDQVVSQRVRVVAQRGRHRSVEAPADVPPPAVVRPLRVLLLGTIPPRDARPEMVVLHFNRQTYEAMVRMTFASLARLDVARLVVRPDPRSRRDRVLESAVASYPTLPVERARQGSVQSLAAEADCVVSFFSGAGIEAAATGVPVVQVLPPGSGNVLPADVWGLVGTARNAAELDALVRRVAEGGWMSDPTQRADVLENIDQPAAPRVVDAILAAEGQLLPRPRPQIEPARQQPLASGDAATRP